MSQNGMTVPARYETNDLGEKGENRIRPWQKEGFKSKKEWLYMKKRIKHLIWQKK